MKLKPCPFCGRTDVVMCDMLHSDRRTIYVVSCKCGCEAPKDSVSKQGAARIWNRRRPQREES